MIRDVLPDPARGLALSRADDELLVEQALEGHAPAFSLLLARHERALRRVVGRVTRHTADTDDALQESALTIWRSLGGLDDPKKVRAWMTRIAEREALRLVTARRCHDELSEDDALVPGPDHHVEHLDTRRWLQEALVALPAQQRQCWALRELGGYTYRDIADRLGVRESTVRGALASARRSVQAAAVDRARRSGAPETEQRTSEPRTARSASRAPGTAVRVVLDASGKPTRISAPPASSRGVATAPGSTFR